MVRKVLLLVAGGLVLCTATAWAQDAILAHFYGKGVHRYFQRDYAGAFNYINQAIENGSNDPRCYYFRGLTFWNLGREDEAREDFQQGAKLELQDTTLVFSVSKALERIQGPVRLIIEDYRDEARLKAMVEQEKLRRARYEELRREEARVLDQSAPAQGLPNEEPQGPAAPAAPAEAAPAQPPAPATAPAPAEAPAPAPPASDNPFAT